MSGEAVANAVIDETDTESGLNWSVSGISNASEFNPDQYTTRESNVTTPDLSNIGREEIDHLINSVRELKSSLATISEKTVTPTNSPRAAKDEFDTVVKKNDQTPPVKDPGPVAVDALKLDQMKNPDSSALKLEQMRKMLRQLENSRQQKSRRSLSFQSVDDQFQEMNDFLDKCKVSNNELLEKERQKVVQLEAEIQSLNQQVHQQNSQVQKYRNEVMQKDKLLMELKACWSEAVIALDKERQDILAEKAKTEEDFKRLKSEQNAAKNQFYVCQGELEKALILASEFKQKLDSDEQVKQDLKQQLMALQALKKAEMDKLMAENSKLSQDLEESQEKLKTVKSDKEGYEKIMARERQQFELQIESVKNQVGNEQAAKLKATEDSLHAFYLTQMESILSEKVSSLQKYINEWEAKLNEDKNQALQNLQAKHNLQIEAFKRQFHQLETQIKASEAIHIASKREAEALKGQLESNFQHQLKSTPSSSTTTSDDEAAGLNSRRSLPLNNRKVRKGSNSRMSSTAATAVTTVMNNLKKRTSLEQEFRPRSAGAKLLSTSNNQVPSASTAMSTPRREGDYSVAGEDHSSLLSSTEKKDLVKAFIKQFLEDNPEAVLDSRLMSGLSEKANMLIDQSFHHSFE